MTTKYNRQSILLACGILATFLYILSDLICAAVYPGYSYTSQAISELSAIGSPTAHLWRVLTFFYDPLLIAFGAGIIISSGKLSLRITGYLLILFGFSGYLWWFFPMNMRGNIGSISDTGHLVLSGLTVLLLTLILAFGSYSSGIFFRIYSFITIAVMLFFGFLVATMAPDVADQKPTPMLGIYERISVFSPMIWMITLSVRLIKNNSR